MKVLFIVPDGVGMRNYLYSDVIKQLKEKAEIVFWSALPKEAFAEVMDLHALDIEVQKSVLPVENSITRLLREAATYARLIYNAKKVNNDSILTNWSKNNKSLKLTVLYKLAEIAGKNAANNYKRILKLEKTSRNHWSRNIIEKYKKDLLEINPTSILITHQRVAGLMPICIAAKELGIKVITVVYSWDNLPKARMAVAADKYIVWSDWMKEEMKTYYPEVPQTDVLVCGTPQFDFYFDKSRIIERAQFAKTYELDDQKRWICYSGSDTITCPSDPDYLKDVAESVRKMPEADRPAIIFRRSPADFSNRYDQVFTEYKDVITAIDPIWFNKGDTWVSFFPKVADVNMLVNMVYHCDAVINLGSTMAHDFAVYNKPCLYINYDQSKFRGLSVKTCYKFQHFKTMEGLDAVGFVNSKNDWGKMISLAINNPAAVGPDRKLWLQKVIQHPLETNSQLIANALM